jgi:type VI secretion system protein ImpA
MPLRDELLTPIAGASPGGNDLLDDPVFLELKEARREDDALPQGDWECKRKTADYPRVVKLASETLNSKSKDLWVAAWLTEALLRRDGYAGLREGLDLLHGLMESFWDDLYPQLEDGDAEMRAAPLSWVGLYLEPAVKSVPLNGRGHGLIQYRVARSVGYEADAENDKEKQEARAEAIAAGKPTLEEFDRAFEATPKPFCKNVVAQLRSCLVTLKSLDEFSEQKFGEFAPNYRTLQTALLEVQEVADDLLAKKLEADPDPPEPEPAYDILSGGPAADATVSLQPENAADAAVRIAAAANFLQQQDPTNPAPYMLLRGFRWGELRTRADELDPRLLSAPPTEMRTRLKGLLLDQKWDQLLEEGEKVMATPHGRGWLDLQRYILTACFKLGSEYDHVAAAVISALTALLRDLPQLPELTLMDDTPTANEETRVWLRESGILEDAAAADVPAGQLAAARERGRSAYDRAQVEVRAGRPEKGIEILMAEVEREKSERARFMHRSHVTGIMVDSGHESVALPTLREMVRKIEAHDLEGWEEGAIVAAPLGLLYRCMSALGESESERHDLYLRICRLDPVQALNFRSENAETRNAAPSEGGDVQVVDLSPDDQPNDG